MTSRLETVFAGQTFLLDADLALWWPDQSLLAVSDLHLEKSTFLARFGAAVAPYDSADTLERLEGLVARYRPRTLLLLGDTFHDRLAWERLEDRSRDQLLAICRSVGSCCFIEGNHDLGMTRDPGLRFVNSYNRNGVLFSHEPVPPETHRPPMPQVIGHFHPKVHTRLRGHRLSGKCFAVNSSLLIMPAFGSFTGGLDLSHPAFLDLGGTDPLRPYLVFRKVVMPISAVGHQIS